MTAYCITPNIGSFVTDGSIYYSTVVLAEDENSAAMKMVQHFDTFWEAENLLFKFIPKCDLDPTDPNYDKDNTEPELLIVPIEIIL